MLCCCAVFGCSMPEASLCFMPHPQPASRPLWRCDMHAACCEQGRAIDDWSQYYSNLSLNLQLLRADSSPNDIHRAPSGGERGTIVPATSLALSGTPAGATCLIGEGHGNNMVGVWEGAAGPGMPLPGRAVLYRFQTAVSVESELFHKPVRLPPLPSAAALSCLLLRMAFSVDFGFLFRSSAALSCPMSFSMRAPVAAAPFHVCGRLQMW